jgi:hypothetical protein
MGVIPVELLVPLTCCCCRVVLRRDGDAVIAQVMQKESRQEKRPSLAAPLRALLGPDCCNGKGGLDLLDCQRLSKDEVAETNRISRPYCQRLSKDGVSGVERRNDKNKSRVWLVPDREATIMVCATIFGLLYRISFASSRTCFRVDKTHLLNALL